MSTTPAHMGLDVAEPAQHIDLPPPEVTFDRIEFLRFFDLMAPNEAITFQTFPDSGRGRAGPRVLHGAPVALVADLERLNEGGSGIFWMVNRGDGEGRRSTNVVAVRALYVDQDVNPNLDKFMNAPAHPNVIVESSPGKYHAYWRVEGCPLDEFSARQQQLIEKFGGDKSIHDLPRVLRVPGSVHRKAAPFRTRILHPSPE